MRFQLRYVDCVRLAHLQTQRNFAEDDAISSADQRYRVGRYSMKFQSTIDNRKSSHGRLEHKLNICDHELRSGLLLL
jgi:hypothetical protein